MVQGNCQIGPTFCHRFSVFYPRCVTQVVYCLLSEKHTYAFTQVMHTGTVRKDHVHGLPTHIGHPNLNKSVTYMSDLFLWIHLSKLLHYGDMMISPFSCSIGSSSPMHTSVCSWYWRGSKGRTVHLELSSLAHCWSYKISVSESEGRWYFVKA